MPTMFEHWTQIRTPEQFAIYYDCIKEVAAEAKAGLVPMNNVAGLDGFKQLYRELSCASHRVRDRRT